MGNSIELSGILLATIGILCITVLCVALYAINKFLKLYKNLVEQNMKTMQKIDHSTYRDPKVVVLGGGTGQSIFLRGLKNQTENITAVVTVADNGGGSGVLREDLGMLPPGDIRNCLMALANIEPTMNEIMQYRFTEGALKGQSFGNLFIAAMTGLYDNFENAVYKMSEIFAITGKVYPVTLEDINLVAELENGETVVGESEIPKVVRKKNTKIKRIKLDKKDVKPVEDVVKSIKDADIIVMGPGSLFTSIIPNLLVKEVRDALITARAPKVYVCNIMSQPGETGGFSIIDHVKMLNLHIGCNIIDYIISNNEELPAGVFERYSKDGAELLIMDKKQRQKLEDANISVIEQQLIEIKKGYIRHDAEEVSKTVVNIARKHMDTKLNCCKEQT